MQSYIKPFHATGLFLYPLETSKKLWFSDVFRGIERHQWHEMGSKFDLNRASNESKYSRMDQVKFVEDSLENI